jgi:hypothetical protein
MRIGSGGHRGNVCTSQKGKKMKKAEKVIETAVVPYEKKALIEFHVTPEEIQAKADECMVLKVLPDNPESYRVAREAHTALVHLRTSWDKNRKSLGEDARLWVNSVNGVYKMLVAITQPAEVYLETELRLEDGRKADIKARKAAEEKDRVDGIRARIDAIKNQVLIQGKSADEIKAMANALLELEITKEIFQEFYEEAMGVRLDIYGTLCTSEMGQRKQEKEDAEREIEADRLAKQKARQEIIEKALEEEKRKIKEAQDRLDAEKRAEQERKDREKFEAEAKERAEKAAKEKVEGEERERKAADAAEKARQEALKPDKEKVFAFAATLLAVQPPTVKGKKLISIVNIATEKLDVLIAEMKEEAKRV